MAYRILFLIGLGFEITGQILLAKGNDFVYQQKPIDFAHWFLLLGVVFLIPQIISFPKKIFSHIGIPITLIGIVCIIGMCVLDFIWWSQPNQEVRYELATHLSKVPSIWIPFITTGPSAKFLNFGLFLLCLNYFNTDKLGVAVIFIATLILLRVIPIPLRLIFGYSLTLIGYSIILLKKGDNNLPQQDDV